MNDGEEKQSNGVSLLGDLLETVKNDLKSEETGPPIHEEFEKIVTRLVRDGMLEEKLQEKLNKYPQPESCEGFSKVRVNQLLWDILSPSIRSQKKVQNSHREGHDGSRSRRRRHLKKCQ